METTNCFVKCNNLTHIIDCDNNFVGLCNMPADSLKLRYVVDMFDKDVWKSIADTLRTYGHMPRTHVGFIRPGSKHAIIVAVSGERIDDGFVLNIDPLENHLVKNVTAKYTKVKPAQYAKVSDSMQYVKESDAVLDVKTIDIGGRVFKYTKDIIG